MLDSSRKPISYQYNFMLRLLVAWLAIVSYTSSITIQPLECGDSQQIIPYDAGVEFRFQQIQFSDQNVMLSNLSWETAGTVVSAPNIMTAFGYVRKANFYGTFRSYVNIPKDSILSFNLTSNDGSLLLLNNITIINNDGSRKSPRSQMISNISLQRGVYLFEIPYFKDSSGDTRQLSLQITNSSVIRGNVTIQDGSFISGYQTYQKIRCELENEESKNSFSSDISADAPCSETKRCLIEGSTSSSQTLSQPTNSKSISSMLAAASSKFASSSLDKSSTDNLSGKPTMQSKESKTRITLSSTAVHNSNSNSNFDSINDDTTNLSGQPSREETGYVTEIMTESGTWEGLSQITLIAVAGLTVFVTICAILVIMAIMCTIIVICVTRKHIPTGLCGLHSIGKKEAPHSPREIIVEVATFNCTPKL